jgi:hypothetical protein
VATRETVTLELDADVASKRRAQAAAESVSEGEIVDGALRAAGFRALLADIQRGSDLDEDAAMKLAVEETRAARASRAA